MSDKWVLIKPIIVVAIAAMLCALSLPALSQQKNNQPTEVVLTFQYRGTVGVYITAYYQNDTFYLPINELFNALAIQYKVDQSNLTVSGNYLGNKDYYLDLRDSKLLAQAGDNEVKLSADDFIISELGYFLDPEIYKQLFDLSFAVDFNSLTLNLQTTDKMPVVAQFERKQKRESMSFNQPLYQTDYFPLKYKRNYNGLDGAFLDYNISLIHSGNSQLVTTSNAVGFEALAGDVQGNLFGAFSNRQSTFNTRNLRWRFVKRNNSYFSSAIAGQTTADGIASRAITGVKISNKPVEPRKLFNQYVVDGETMPESEIELYLNNRLIDYQEASASGNYRFVVPLTYGSTNYSVRIFTPSGRSIEQNSRVQIPFEYLPPGKVDYTASFGKLEDPLFGSRQREYQAQTTIATGITDWLTASTSAEYLTDYHETLPSITGTLNARLFSRYLVSANISSENFYRFTSNVVYTNGTSWNASYDYNPGNSRIYNIVGNEHQARLNLFKPFQIGNTPLNIRISSNFFKTGTTEFIRYRTDLSTRLGRLNIRLGFQDQQVAPFTYTTTTSSKVTNSYTYNISRGPQAPDFFRGMFLRAQLSYLPGLKKLERTEFQLSKDFFKKSRAQLTFAHNFLIGFNSLNFNFTIDFNKTRSNTSARSSGSQFSLNQSFRGSIGYDSYGDQLLLNNRQQVGQSGAAVRLFVDNNNDGAYQDSLDDVISDPAVRLDRAGGRTFVDDGINYITQLLPYYRYNIEVNKSALSNPLLVPNIENFSIVTDPNQFKKIEIPFYLSGVLSGRVDQLQTDSTLAGLSGVRVFLESDFHEELNREPVSKELRTFSDGSFYTYEIPPGKYQLYIDPNQLEFLGATAQPDTLNLEVKALAQGDFLENLNFVVTPNDLEIKETIFAQNDESKIDSQNQNKPSTTFFGEAAKFQIQLSSYSTLQLADAAADRAQNLFGTSFTTIFNTAANLYGIRSDIYKSRTDALQILFEYQKSEFSNPALVVIKTRDNKTTETSYSAIQIAAFRSMQRAKKDAALSSIKLDTETYIYNDEENGWYKVHILKAKPLGVLASKLDQVKQKSFFSDAFINSYNAEATTNNLAAAEITFKYQVHVEGVTAESAQAFRSSIMNEGNTDSDILQPKTDLIIFENIDSWDEVVRLKNNLSKVSTIGRPVIVIVEE